MKIQGHLHDYPLSDLLEILANRQESGCLRIEFEPEPALFYFNRGLLVDARMSFLKGFPAVHLALSRAEASFCFDNTVAPPELAIIDENERLLLSGILKVKLSGNVEFTPALAPPPIVEETISDAPAKTTSIEIVDVEKAEPVPEPAIAVETAHEELNTSVFAKEVGPATVVHQQSFLIEPKFDYDKWTKPNRVDAFLDTLSSYAPGKRALRIAAVVFIIAIPATVGITVLIGKKNSSEQVSAATRETAPNTTTQDATTPSVTTPEQPQETTSTPETREAESAPMASSPKPADAVAQPPAAAASHTPTTSPNAAANSKPVANPPANETPKDNRSSQAAAADSAKPTEQPAPAAESTSKTIVVMVRVEDGHVAEAWVKDSRKGLEAYEATALRLARQRRYSAGANRTESVPVTVSINK
jgi:hypothetical protein